MNNRQGMPRSGTTGARRVRGRPNSQAPALDLTSPTERFDYVADMVQALRAISAQAKCQTLTNLLDLAYHEAVLRRRSGKGN